MAIRRYGARRTVERRVWRPIMFGPGMILGLVATLAVVVSLFLPWRTGGVHPSDIPAAFLWDRGATSDPSLLIFLVPLAAVLVLGAVVWGGDVARVFGGLGILIVAGVFAYQLDRAGNDFGADLGSLLDTGFYVAVIGGFLAWVERDAPRELGRSTRLRAGGVRRRLHRPSACRTRRRDARSIRCRGDWDAAGRGGRARQQRRRRLSRTTHSVEPILVVLVFAAWFGVVAGALLWDRHHAS